jgi:hypothetical protein
MEEVNTSPSDCQFFASSTENNNILDTGLSDEQLLVACQPYGNCPVTLEEATRLLLHTCNVPVVQQLCGIVVE